MIHPSVAGVELVEHGAQLAVNFSVRTGVEWIVRKYKIVMYSIRLE